MQRVHHVQHYDEDSLTSETERVERDGAVVETTRTAEPASVIAARIVWLIAGIIIALLAIRFVLILLGASTGSPFVALVYALSYPFAVPFFGMFNYSMQYGVSRFELSTLVAMAVYALIAWGISRLLTIRRTDRTVA